MVMGKSCEEEIRIVSIDKVRPSNLEEAHKRIDLTPWDIIFLPIRYMQSGLLFSSPKNTTSAISHLKASLSKTLDHFYPLAGRFVIENNNKSQTISVYINCNSAGVEFVHARADITISNIVDQKFVPHIVRSFFRLNDLIGYDGQNYPLVSVQVTELKDGMFIGCSMNHCVADGSSLWHFFSSWSEISRSETGENSISRPPVLKRWFPNDTEYPISIPFPTDVEKRLTKRNPYVPSLVLEDGIFHFTRENIARLKAKANQETGGKLIISSFQALLGHFWKGVIKAKCLDPHQETVHALALGNRSRLNPPLPDEYFGNSVSVKCANVRAGDLLENGLGWAASKFNELVVSHTDEWIRSYLEYWVDNPQLFFPTKDPFFSMATGNSPNFKQYGNDFGWGKPIATRSGNACKFEGMTGVTAGREEGSIDIQACLRVETFEAMAKDPEFMEFVTVLPHFLSVCVV